MKFAYLLAVCAALVSVPLAAFAALPVTPVPVESRGDRQFGNLCRYVSHNRWSLDYIIAHSVESSPVGEPTLTPAELRAFQAIRDRCVDDKLSGTAADIWTSPLLGRLSRAIGRAFLAATKQRCIAAKATPADKALVLKVIDGPNGLARPGVDPLHEKLAKLKASLSGGAVDCDALDHHQWAALLSVEAQPTAARTAFAEEFGAGGQAVVEVAIGPGLDLTAAKLPGPVQSNPAPASSVEAAIIQGVTDFVVSRAKAEVADYALGKLRGLMCDGQAAPWFENSCAYLGDGTSDLGVLLGDGLRKAFSRDVATAPRVALELIKPDASVVKERRLFAAWVALEALVGFIDTRTPAGVVARLAAEQPVPWTDANLRSLAEDVRIVAIVVRAALAQSSKLRGPTPDDLGFIQAVLDDLQQEAVTLQASAPTSAQKLLDLCGKLSAITDHALQAKQLVARVKAVVHDVESVENGKTQAERTTAGISAVRGTADLVNQVLQLVGGANVGADAKLQAEIAALADLLEASIRGDLTSLIGALTKDLNVFLVGKGGAQVVRLLALGAELAKAESSEDVTAAIEQVAAPAGAWREKRVAKQGGWPSLSVGALAGIAAGTESIVDSRVNDHGVGPVFQPFLPIGFDVNWATGCGCTAGVFISLFQLGTLVSWRDVSSASVQSGKTVVDAKISTASSTRWQQVFAPGLYGRVGLGDSPFVVGTGVEFAPLAREVQPTDTSLPSTDVAVFRWLAFVAVDVPILMF